jgi:uncharacterized protein YdiU (UPF0061 family)
MPASPHYLPDPAYAALNDAAGGEYADPVKAADFPNLILRRRNQVWAERVGLGDLTSEEWAAHFGNFAPLPGNQPEPLAMRYHGHQFRNYNPDIGDGRGFLFAQLRDDQNRLLDLATKGSGQTPYSRFGDGRLTLKGGVREVLAADMLEAQGVYTSKAFSLFETGEALERHDEPSPTRASVLVRLSHSHLRLGTFQRLAFFERPDLINQLIEHIAENYFPDLKGLSAEDRAAGLLERTARELARLAASWMAAGFVHGVLNTDNLTVTGESFDYGPWRFLPRCEPGFTAAYFDQNGLYCYARQPEAVGWALAQFAGALSLVAPVPKLEAALEAFKPAYGEAMRVDMHRRLGLTRRDDETDVPFVESLFAWLAESGIAWDQFFHDWFCGEASAARAAQSPLASFYEADLFRPIRAQILARASERPERLSHALFQRQGPPSLVIENVEAIWAPIAERDDWSAFEGMLAEIESLKDALGMSCHQAFTPPA